MCHVIALCVCYFSICFLPLTIWEFMSNPNKFIAPKPQLNYLFILCIFNYILIGSICRNFKLIPYSTLWFQHDCIIDELMRSKIILWRNADLKVKDKNRSYSIMLPVKDIQLPFMVYLFSFSLVGIHDPLKTNVKWENSSPRLVIIEHIK